MRLASVLLLSLTFPAFMLGCSRTRYRTAADRDSYRIIQEKSRCLEDKVDANYTIRPDSRSRFFDATNPDCPQLPVPRPILYGYQLPQLASDANGCNNCNPLLGLSTDSNRIEIGLHDNDIHGRSLDNSVLDDSKQPPSDPVNTGTTAPTGVVQATYRANGIITIAEEPTPEPEQVSEAKSTSRSRSEINKVKVPVQAWTAIPESCLSRMMEFTSIQQEYEYTFAKPYRSDSDAETPSTDGSQSASNRRLSLANLMELTSINSREYQARKEVLFRTALALTRQRFQFELNPSQFGNGTAANYRHLRQGGVTDNRLAVPSGVGVEKTLATGGEFLARFANSIVLTFNGPSGFATDIGSEMIFDFQQTIFQRDIRFELLTQTERDVVYATRDYLRFRKQLFRDIANQYYNLLLNYRNVEINAQDYFTNLRGFLQSQAEYRTAEKIPRIQVDQFEQNVLRTRGNLVNNCFTLEASLDQLKLRMGIPTEMTLFLDLKELESISLKDELSVARQMIARARSELLIARNANVIDATTLANVAEVLAERMRNILSIQRRMDESQQNVESDINQSDYDRSNRAVVNAEGELRDLQQLLQILGTRMQVDVLRAELKKQIQSETPAPPLRVLIRAIELSVAELQVVDLAMDGAHFEANPQKNKLITERASLNRELSDLTKFIEDISDELRSQSDLTKAATLEQIPSRTEMSVKLVERLEQLAADVTRDVLPMDGDSIPAKVQMTVDKTISLSDKLLQLGPDGWEEIELDHDEALLTGLVQRLDLMNQRGELADAWRQIKLAGDDLKSIVDLRATQFLRTKSGSDNPFDFSFDDSETRLSVALDTPLNRRLQRNNFRLALINYNVGLRNLMALEDGIKLDVREDLRQLALDRSQYAIAVASAALAYERVISTKLRLQLGVQNVAARDFLESQQAYTNALTSIARQHVNYITDRIELFFDLEEIDVDACGFWPGVTQDYGPQVNTDFQRQNPRPYDTLPPNVRYSPAVRQMERIVPGAAEVR
jgi:hypothetical protein